MKKDKWLIAAAAAVTGVAALAYQKITYRQLPEGAWPVEPFDADRYIGKWYEVARFESRIEKDLRSVTEQYFANPDGTIKVITKGYNYKQDKWVEATGKIKFAAEPNVGMLKVSYFGPFYAAYNVLDLDADYKYALVSTNNLDYLWILSRDTAIPADIKQQFLNTARSIGFDVSKLQWV